MPPIRSFLPTWPWKADQPVFTFHGFYCFNKINPQHCGDIVCLKSSPEINCLSNWMCYSMQCKHLSQASLTCRRLLQSSPACLATHSRAKCSAVYANRLCISSRVWKRSRQLSCCTLYTHSARVLQNQSLLWYKSNKSYSVIKSVPLYSVSLEVLIYTIWLGGRGHHHIQYWCSNVL